MMWSESRWLLDLGRLAPPLPVWLQELYARHCAGFQDVRELQRFVVLVESFAQHVPLADDPVMTQLNPHALRAAAGLIAKRGELWAMMPAA